ncbi:MAG: glycosyltransferase [Saprospiraceae bacterium]|nr:glycosyltransferase [Saprospiraceae bacterium]
MPAIDAWGFVCSIWVLCGLVQLYFWLRVFAPLIWHRSAHDPDAPPVSVIICAHRLTAQLPELLGTLRNQDYPQYEVILVNDGGIAGLSTLVSQSGYPVREVVLHREEKHAPGKKGALARGIAAATYDWLLLTDADCQVSQAWIGRMVSCAGGGHQLVLGFGPLMRAPGLAVLLARFDNLMIGMQYLGLALAGRPYMGVGRNLLYHRSLYDQAGGFSDHADVASGDDDLFVQAVANRHNTAICLHRDSVVWSPAEQTLVDLLYQKRRHLSTASRYRGGVKRGLALFGATLIVWWLGALLLAGFDPSQTFIVIAAAGGLIQWAVFAGVANKLKVPGLSLWFVPVSLLYAVFLLVQGILVLLGPPRTWRRS